MEHGRAGLVQGPCESLRVRLFNHFVLTSWRQRVAASACYGVSAFNENGTRKVPNGSWAVSTTVYGP